MGLGKESPQVSNLYNGYVCAHRRITPLSRPDWIAALKNKHTTTSESKPLQTEKKKKKKKPRASLATGSRCA
jgi:hypothetical protein